jgi:hypothetical protein
MGASALTGTAESAAIDTSGRDGTGAPFVSTDAATPPRAHHASHRPDYLLECLADAELLLQHVAATGPDVAPDVRNGVLRARAVPVDRWTEEMKADLLVALTKLAACLRPVSAQSIRACDAATVRQYLRVTILVALVIVPFSLLSFMTSAISEPIRKDIASANDLAVKLTARLGTTGAAVAARSATPPADVVLELQQFTSLIRAIDSRARRLNYFVLSMENVPYRDIRDDPVQFGRTFELPPNLGDLVEIKNDKIAVLQKIRYFGQSVLDDVAVFYGAFAACFLPVLYAVLGTCAYLLRRFEQETAAKTFIPSRANSARFVIAGIAGAVVGLFNFTISEGASISPLAIAFLAGYAIDVFFSFLETLTSGMTRNASPPPAG